MKKVIFFLGIVTAVLISAGTVYAAQTINDTLQVASLKVGQQGAGGVTFFNGTIVNETTADGLNNPITIGDGLRVDGDIYRGSRPGAGDNSPLKINDDAQISGSLTVNGGINVGSIIGLSNMVSTAGFAKTTDLTPYAKTSDLSSYAKTTDLTPFAKTTDLSPYAKTTDLTPYAKTTDLTPYAKTTDLLSYATTTSVSDLSNNVDILSSNLDAVYNYNRCTLNLGQYLTYPTISNMLFCWDLWVGTSLSASITTSLDSIKTLNTNQDKLNYSDKLRIEMDRAAKLSK